MLRCFDTSLIEDDAQFVASQVRSQRVGPGAMVAEFEQQLVEHTGYLHAVCCNSGTTALMLALMANGYEDSGMVVCPAYGHPGAANAARIIGCKVVLRDLVPSPDYDADVFLAHNGAILDSIVPWVNILDCAQCMGMPWPRGVCAGKTATLSFSPQKLVTTGQGGALLTDDADVARCARDFIDQGGHWRKDKIYKQVGGNFRMSDINAALGVSQMRRLPEMVARRNEVHDWYRKEFGSGNVDCGWSVIVRAKEPRLLISNLVAKDIEACQPYQPMHFNYEYWEPEGTFPIAEETARESVYLPGHLNVTKEAVQEIAFCVSISGRLL